MGMGKIKSDEVKHVSVLAKLSLSNSELRLFQKQLSQVLSHFEDLEKVNTTATPPTAQTTGLKNVSRKDIVSQETGLTQNEILSGSKNTQNNYFVTKHVFEESS